ncbi:MAG: bZIP transcription factor [Lachnospiraceae bacterium]|nr:bZIP transcription factor [Lachnospiraceae bacterium]
MDEINQIFDRIFKRIFTFSDMAITNLINGLFGTNHPPDSQVEYSNRESTKADLSHTYADIFIIINKTWHYHLEAQVYHDKTIVMRVFEYGFYHALETREDNYTLQFPEPVVIYFCNEPNVPEISSIRIVLPDQQEFTYTVKNYVYLRHNLEELNRKKMIVFIPFQMVRVRDRLLPNGKVCFLSENDIQELKNFIESDILGSIKANLQVGNIMLEDYNQLLELTNELYQQILLQYQKKGGSEDMKPLLPGALELPNDKYRFQIDELETEVASLTSENTSLTSENASLTNENASLIDKVQTLEQTVAELQRKLNEDITSN